MFINKYFKFDSAVFCASFRGFIRSERASEAVSDGEYSARSDAVGGEKAFCGFSSAF